MKPKKNQVSDINQILGIDKGSNFGKLKRRLLLAAFILLAIMAIFIWVGVNKGNSINYETKEAKRGDLSVIVTATGNLEPTEQVEVGSEVSGIIEVVEVDYNDRVKMGQVLARLDTSLLRPKVLESKAALESARAAVLEAQATVREKRNELARLKKVLELSGGKVPSQNEMDAAEAAFKRAQANEASAKAKVSEAQATLEANESDLAKAVIYSPINGIVLERSVEPGQTVAASFQTPVLFTLAEDLTNMELHVNVDEADVGHVKEGQKATFTVDAYPNRTFPAQITQVRYGSQEVEGVITYETILNVDNSNLLLRPGMTATADITVKEIKDAILVPNAALRFNPSKEKEEVSSSGGSIISKLLPHSPRHRAKQREDVAADKKQQRVWTVQNGELIPIDITVGSTNGIMTEVTSGNVEAGIKLVIDIVIPD
jgi:HlyD family secretion protein